MCSGWGGSTYTWKGDFCYHKHRWRHEGYDNIRVYIPVKRCFVSSFVDLYSHDKFEYVSTMVQYRKFTTSIDCDDGSGGGGPRQSTIFNDQLFDRRRGYSFIGVPRDDGFNQR